MHVQQIYNEDDSILSVYMTVVHLNCHTYLKQIFNVQETGIIQMNKLIWAVNRLMSNPNNGQVKYNTATSTATISKSGTKQAKQPIQRNITSTKLRQDIKSYNDIDTLKG